MSKDLEVMAEGKFVRFVNDNGWEFAQRINSTGVVVIVAMTDDRKVIFVEQYRPPVKKRVIELPAGLAGDLPGEEEEAFQLAAQRELLEETGYRSGKITYLMDGPTSVGLTSEVIHFYRAFDIIKEDEGGGVEGEDILVHEIPLTKVDQWLEEKREEGILIDPKVYAGLYFLTR